MDGQSVNQERLPFLLALQFHPEAKNQAMAMASLMADLEPSPQMKMGFMFCPKFDTLVDTTVEAKVKAKFPDTRIFQCKSRARGWPQGPNAQAHEVYAHFYAKCHDLRDPWRYCAILMGEPDCLPMTPDWVSQLQDEWYTCDWHWTLGSGYPGNQQLVLGHWVARDDSQCRMPHINGNCMLSPEFMTRYRAFTQTTFGAWDTTHSRATLNWGRPSKKIYSDYNIGGKLSERKYIGCADLMKPRIAPDKHPLAGTVLHPAYLHGIKDDRAIADMRKILLDNFSDPSMARLNAHLHPPTQTQRTP